MAETALVTGATSGLGESLCLLLASDGYNLVTVARNKKALKRQAAELRSLDIDVTPLSYNLAKKGAAQRVFEAVRERDIHVDILVNNACYSPAGRFDNLSVADIRAMLQLSVVSLTELTSVFLRPMLKRGRERILNMSSMAAKAPCPNNALYGAASAFVLSFTTALAYELEDTNVTATAICPGATRTNFQNNAGLEDAAAWRHFAMDCDETAIHAYRALMRGDRHTVIGWPNKVGAFSARFMPLEVQAAMAAWLIGSREHPLEREMGSFEDGEVDDDEMGARATAERAAATLRNWGWFGW